MSEQSALEKIALDYLKERKRTRWFRRLILLLIIISVVALFFSSDEPRRQLKPHIGVIDIKGPIFAGAKSSAKNIISSINHAYHAKKMQALVLRINSPGGSPVQASYIFKELRRLKKKFPHIKTYAVCSDLCASAAYYIAAGSDTIVADESSMVGSIGVLFNGFGFVELMQKLGIKRRLITAGANKGFLDPFSPEQADQVTQLKSMLADVHKQFIASVKLGRASRLKESESTFSGLIWTGGQAKSLGLVDEIGSLWSISRETVKLDKIINYTKRQSFAERISRQLGAAIGVGAVEQASLATLRLS